MIIWIAFCAFVIFALALDLGVFNKTPHAISAKEAAIWTGVWITIAVLFSGVIFSSFKNEWVTNPTQLTPYNAVVKYITGYLIELSLSVDNIFIIAVIFSSFGIPQKYQHEVLFYGVLGAIVFRALMVFFGVALINNVSWIIYLFGGFLIFTAIKMLRHKNEDFDPQRSKTYKLIRKIFPVTQDIEGGKFFIKKEGAKFATPLFVALIIIELTDVLFAVDSIPAILAISADPFIVFSSNILAVMGLRSMFFLISGMLVKFRYMNYSLVVILAYVGVKMIFSHHIDFPEWLSLGVIVLALGTGSLASVLIPEKDVSKRQLR